MFLTKRADARKKGTKTMSKKRYYLAYGSNMNYGQMQARCPDAKPVGTALLLGYELLFKVSKTGAYLTIEKKKGGCVPLAVWEVSAADERNLDRCEGCPTYYYKKEMRLPVERFASGRTTKTNAFIYIMHEYRRFGIPTGRYLYGCVKGYRTFGFDPKYLYDAFERSASYTF